MAIIQSKKLLRKMKKKHKSKHIFFPTFSNARDIVKKMKQSKPKEEKKNEMKIELQNNFNLKELHKNVLNSSHSHRSNRNCFYGKCRFLYAVRFGRTCVWTHFNVLASFHVRHTLTIFISLRSYSLAPHMSVFFIHSSSSFFQSMCNMCGNLLIKKCMQPHKPMWIE